jgi:hypothetical protein
LLVAPEICNHPAPAIHAAAMAIMSHFNTGSPSGCAPISTLNRLHAV